MGGIEIATNNDGFCFFEILEMFEESRVPESLAKLESRQVIFAVGSVDIDKIKLWIFDGLDATFAEGVTVDIGRPIVTNSQIIGKIGKVAFWGFSGKDGGTRITRAVGRVPYFVIFRKIDG